MTELARRLDEFARREHLLVATDYDGTLAPIVDDPEAAEGDHEALVALGALARMPQTHVAIISGRARSDLAGRTAAAGAVHLVGSHGSEFAPGLDAALAPDAGALLARLNAEVSTVARRFPGCLVEAKPASVAFHYRKADAALTSPAVEAILRGPGAWRGVHVRHGKKVIECSVVAADKGTALDRLRQRLGAETVVFIGDDVTDEDAFRRLGESDAGIKVGPGATAAAYRVADADEVSRLLSRIAARRAEWLAELLKA